MRKSMAKNPEDAEIRNCYAFMKLFGTLDVDMLAKMPEIRFVLLADCIKDDPEFKPIPSQPSGRGVTKLFR